MPNGYVPLTESQINHLVAVTQGGTTNFAVAYAYIYAQFQNNPNVGSDVLFWFEQAANINANIPGPANT